MAIIHKNQNGFTMIEVLLSLAIFTIIGMASVKQISQIKDTKEASAAELETYNELRTAISILRNDLTQAFHILFEDLGEENVRALQAQEAIPHTVFDGRKNELVFTSLSHRVYYMGLRESEQTEISFFLQTPDGGSTPSLMKRESPIIDGNLYEGGSVYTLLDNVQSLTFKFWDPETRKWYDDWNSDQGEFRDRFPMAVQVFLTVAREGKPNLEIQNEIKIAFPNNTKYVAEF